MRYLLEIDSPVTLDHDTLVAQVRAAAIDLTPVAVWAGVDVHLVDRRADLEHARVSDGKANTSRAAADLIRPRAGSLRAKVLDALMRHPSGLTDPEICAATGIGRDTCRARRVELVKGGWAEAAKAPGGRARTRKPDGHANAFTVWQVTVKTLAAQTNGA